MATRCSHTHKNKSGWLIMDHLTMLSKLYQAYQNDDSTEAELLLIAYPDVAGDTIRMILAAETHQDFLQRSND